MRIQQLPESHMLHGRVIPQGTTPRGEMPAHQKEKSDGHWFHFHFSAVSPAPLIEISTGVNHLPQQDWARQGPVGWWEKEEFLSSEVWRKKKPNQPNSNNRNQPKTKPQNKQPNKPRPISQSSPEGDRRTWEKRSEGHPLRPTIQLFQQCQGSFHDQASRVLLPNTSF